MSILDKKNIRKKMLKERKAMEKEKVKELSKEIIRKLEKIPEYKSSKTIMLYLSFANEVDSREIIKRCLKSGKRVVLPFCEKEDMSITPTEIKNIDIDTKLSKIGYRQPDKDKLLPVDTKEIDLIVLPGLAFDKKAYRIGFGAGYYDRFLGKLNFQIPTIGLAYDFQIIESFIKMEDYDIPLDYVITEERIILRTN